MTVKDKFLALFFSPSRAKRTTEDIKIDALKDVRSWEAKVYKDLALKKDNAGSKEAKPSA